MSGAQSILGEGGFAPHKVLNPHYSKIKRHLEIDMYCGEGSRVYRRAMHRLRTEQLCIAVFTGRREPPATRRPRHLRWCLYCPMHEACDVNHFMARCPHRTQERALMEAAVRETMPAAVLAWLGTPWTRPERWVALWLDGEIEGVPFAEAYGRSTRSIRAFHGFESNRRAYMVIITARTTLGVDRAVGGRQVQGGRVPEGAPLGDAHWVWGCADRRHARDVCAARSGVSHGQPRRPPLEPRAVVVAGSRCRGVPFVQTRGRSQEDPWVEVPGT